MVQSLYENNMTIVSGKIVTEPTFSHEVYGEGFYSFYINVKRLSDSYDKIPVLVSERLTVYSELKVGAGVRVEGQFRSYNAVANVSNKLLLMIFAREIEIFENIEDMKNENSIALNGFVCKKPIYRTTPFGREIADILLAVNRTYNKSDYIPCISWGRNAKYCSKFNVGDNVKVWGRIQSREYQKKFHDGTVENRVAYEISVSKLELERIEEKENDAVNTMNISDEEG